MVPETNSGALPPDARRLMLLRLWILVVLVLGQLGTLVELILLEHYEEPIQFVPLVLIVLSLGALAWHARAATGASRVVLYIVMTVSVLSGFLGFVEHFAGSTEFQREIMPDIDGWELFLKVIRAKAPPLLAPGMMIQTGLLGLAYAFFTPPSQRSEP